MTPGAATGEGRAEESAPEGSPETGPSAGAPDEGASVVRADLSLRTVRHLLAGVPGLARLLWRLMRDPRVSRLDRVLFGFTLAYLVVPVDLVPAWILGLGQLDDLVIATVALDRLLHRTPEAVLLEHWKGDVTPLLVVRDLVDRVTGVLPGWGRKLLRAG